MAAPPVEKGKDIATHLRESILLSCSLNISRLGDLSRWREEKRASGDPEWAHAIGFYDLAGYLRPQSGLPYHQRAVIARASQESNLKTVYWFLRALVCAEPHPAALGNLDLLYKKILKPSKHRKSASTSTLEPGSDAGDLANVFCTPSRETP